MRTIFNQCIRFQRLLCLLLTTVVMSQTVRIEAAEPDGRLYSDNADERFSIYKIKSEQLTEALKIEKDPKNIDRIQLQQDLLTKLKEFPTISTKQTFDTDLPKYDGTSSNSWQNFDLFLTRYQEIMKEKEKSISDLEVATRKMEELYKKLIALDEKNPDISILQLQYATQVLKVDNQKIISAHLNELLIKLNDEFPKILHHTKHIYRHNVENQAQIVQKSIQKVEQLKEKTEVKATGITLKIQQQEQLLAGYLGRELSDIDKKKSHYEQLKLLNLQLEHVLSANSLLKAQIDSLNQTQVLIWFRLLSGSSDFFNLAHTLRDVNINLNLNRDEITQQQKLTHTFEKDISSLGGGNALLGPKAEELLNELNQKVKIVYEQLSGVEQLAEALEKKGILLEEGIALKQSTIGSVVTRTKVATDEIYKNIIGFLRYPLLSYNGINISPLLILQLITLLVVGIFINRTYCHIIYRVGKKRAWTERTTHLVQAVGKYPFIFLVAMILLSVVGINTRSLTLVAGALSVGVGFGMQTTANNLVSGIILLFDKSISPGDFISLGERLQKGGTRGTVVQMNVRATVIRTNDNINVIIPNADLIASQVVNWTYSDEKIRLRIPFSVSYGTNNNKIKALVENAVVGIPIVLPRPKPQIWLEKQTGSSLHYLATIWVEGQNARQPAKTTDTILSAILDSLYTHRIEMPDQIIGDRNQGESDKSIFSNLIHDPSALKMPRLTMTQ